MTETTIPARGAGPKPAVVVLNDARDTTMEAHDLTTAIEMMAMDIDGNQQGAFIRVAQAIKAKLEVAVDHIDTATTAMKESGE